VAHGGGSADRETADENGRLLVPPGEDAYTLRRVWLSEEEENGYYYGFSNEGLWPLCHLAHARPLFREEDWRQYKAVNERFADAVCQEANRDDAVILVQDYHFALAPRMIRERLPRATIISFWHIPWPNAEGFGICPWRKELLEGLLGSSTVGFHTQLHCNNFLDAVDRYLESRIDREQLAAPSRTKIERYRRLNDEVAALAARINARFAPLVPGGHWKPILLARSHHEPPAVFRALRAADFCYVSSLHDGMNLVAKEFVAARSDERGVLILSQFTGAARELPEALIVNPYDLEETSSAIAAALSMSEREQSERMRSMRAFVAEFNVYRWAGRMLIDAARLRRRGRYDGLPSVLPTAESAEQAAR
jgi:trehalose-6-phosphate synthase